MKFGGFWPRTFLGIRRLWLAVAVLGFVAAFVVRLLSAVAFSVAALWMEIGYALIQ